MTVYVHHELACDHPDCFNAYQAGVDEVNSLQRTRRGATTAGWTRVRGASGDGIFDRCPQHRDWRPE
jgi:hypothetical protein